MLWWIAPGPLASALGAPPDRTPRRPRCLAASRLDEATEFETAALARLVSLVAPMGAVRRTPLVLVLGWARPVRAIPSGPALAGAQEASQLRDLIGQLAAALASTLLVGQAL